MSKETSVSVATLWKRLQDMENEKRFNGQAYPEGMSYFPFRLTGQGFFPGGDGLWRDDADIARESPGVITINGIMFLGNDFGTCQSYERLRKKGFENPLTWKHVKCRVSRAGLPQSLTFFTNAVMGLRKEGSALEKKNWDEVPAFAKFCREFLIFQIETLRPRLIVVMGPIPKSTLDSLAVGSKVCSGRFPLMQFGSHKATIYYGSHPYGDFNFSEERKIRDGLELEDAWGFARQQ
ncbi:MAG TPA: hypothetical protein VG225_02800 [Terracidiphilus sp.]|jgi:hypothetical protein|nr:hypothetical protein [Terracidiphilus sp.]